MKLTLLKLFIIVLLVSCNPAEKKKMFSEVQTSADDISQQSPEAIESINRGKDIYTDFCMNCHLPDGKGVAKTFPPLANSDYLMNNRKESIQAIKYGMSGKITVNVEVYDGAMAPLGLENDEIADVMNYITNNWGNTNGKLITEAEVLAIEQ